MIELRHTNRLIYIGGGITASMAMNASAATDWWNPGGSYTCVAAYQAKGAASQAASYVNLANPSTYDLTEGAAPTWATGTGWTGTASSYLLTGITPSTGWSMLVRYSNAAAITVPCGSRKSVTDSSFYFIPDDAGGVTYCNQGLLAVSTALASGVLAIAGQKAYRNGVADGNIPTATNTQWYGIYVMARNTAGTASLFFNNGVVSAVAIYSTTLDATQVATLSTAMAAL